MASVVKDGAKLAGAVAGAASAVAGAADPRNLPVDLRGRPAQHPNSKRFDGDDDEDGEEVDNPLHFHTGGDAPVASVEAVRAQQEARDANHLSRENQKEGFDAGARDETLSRIVVDENVARPSTNPINTCLKMLGVNTATHAVDVSIYKGACDD